MNKSLFTTQFFSVSRKESLVQEPFSVGLFKETVFPSIKWQNPLESKSVFISQVEASNRLEPHFPSFSSLVCCSENI